MQMSLGLMHMKLRLNLDGRPVVSNFGQLDKGQDCEDERQHQFQVVGCQTAGKSLHNLWLDNYIIIMKLIHHK